MAFRGYRTRYRVVGQMPPRGGRPALLVLHGGPGLPHDYPMDMAELAEGDRKRWRTTVRRRRR